MTLCEVHARQAMKEHQQPYGLCGPVESWIGGSGQTVHCEFAVDPAGVASWFVVAQERRAANKARSRWAKRDWDMEGQIESVGESE